MSDEQNEKKNSEKESWQCEKTGRKLKGPDDTPNCEHCDPETGACQHVVSSKKKGSGSQSSGRGAVGSGRVYRFRDTSVRDGGADHLTVGADRGGSLRGPVPEQGPGLFEPWDDDDEHWDGPDELEKMLEAYERAFDEEMRAALVGGIDGPEWGFLPKPITHRHVAPPVEEQALDTGDVTFALGPEFGDVDVTLGDVPRDPLVGDPTHSIVAPDMPLGPEPIAPDFPFHDPSMDLGAIDMGPPTIPGELFGISPMEGHDSDPLGPPGPVDPLDFVP